jgi:archaellum component FlaC
MDSVKEQYKNFRLSQIAASPDIKKYSQKQIDNHLSAEFDLIRHDIVRKDLIPTIKMPSDFGKFIKDFMKNSSMKIDTKELMVDVFNKSLEHIQLKNEIENFFTKNRDFKKWIVYEAATGVYKFSGKPGYSNDVKLEPIANKIMEFNESGTMRMSDITKEWCEGFTDKVKVVIGFKSTKNKFSTFRLATKKEKIDEDVDGTEQNFIENIIENEIENFNNNLNSLDLMDESLSDIMQKIKNTYNKMIDFIKNFYENIFKKIIIQLKEWAQNGLDYLLQMLGIEIEGEAFADVQF